MIGEQVGAGRLMAELTEHSHDLAAVERGVIGNVQDELSARNPMAHRKELPVKIGFRPRLNVFAKTFPYGRPELEQSCKIGPWI